MKISVSDLRPNPFRDLSRYPIDEDKVAALVVSIKDTDFWNNLIARPAPNGAGGFELAYGVHRLKALKKAGIDEIDIPVRKLDDTMMAKIMAHENQVEWAASALIAQETVRAIVQGFAEGKIELPGVRSQGTPRYAPLFDTNTTSPGAPNLAYSVSSLAKFLGGEKAGWPDGKIEAILRTLAVIESKLIDEEDLKGLSVHQAGQVAVQARRVAKETGKTDLAKAVGKNLAAGMRTATGRKPGRGGKSKGQRQAITYHGAKRAADKMMGSHRRKTTTNRAPPIEKFSEQLCLSIGAAFPTDKMQAKLDAILKFRDDLPVGSRVALVRALRNLAARATKLADKLEG